MAKEQKEQKAPKEQKQKKGGAPAAEAAEPAGKPARPRANVKEGSRLKQRFQKEIAPALMKELELANPMAVPHVEKVVINMGVGEATQNAKVLDPAANELGQIAGQKPIITTAKKS